jgi:hypothetical protein
MSAYRGKQTSRRRADTSGFDNGHRRRIDANNLDRKAHYFSRILHFYLRYMMSPAIFAAEARSCSKNPLTCSRPPLYFSDFRGFK